MTDTFSSFEGSVRRHPKDFGTMQNPESNVAHASAFRTVFLYNLATAFELTQDEILWTGYRLDQIFASLLEHRPASVPVAVRQEMLDRSYTRLLAAQTNPERTARPTVSSPTVLTADLGAWADALIDTISTSYALLPVTEAEMQVQVVHLLADLGVGEPSHRAATYLPNELRARLGK